jgi:glyoxylase-like metal-dependent hydrolase (beta-lactamase superfamily II)
MRSVSPGVFLETKFPGVMVGAVASRGRLLMVDAPIRVEDGREWVSQLGEKGKPRCLVLLDHHLDRVLGARGFELPIVAHDTTRLVMGGWPDTFKGGTRPIGAEADRLKRVTGVTRAVPDLTFSEEISLHLEGREILLLHRPGPTAGSIWVVVPEAKAVFIGDAVWLGEPAYLGDARLDAWQKTLQQALRGPFKGFTFISSRDGVVERKAFGQMAVWLDRVEERLRKLKPRGALSEAAGALATGLMRGSRLPAARREHAHLRLQAGLERLYARWLADEA